MSARRQLLLVLLAAAVLGAIASGFLTTAWVSENLSGDFADQESGEIHLGFTAAIFLIWSALLATPWAIVGAVAIGVRVAMHARRSRMQGG
jgi:hypothetical protein